MIIELLVLLFTTTSCSAKNKKSEKDYSPMHRSEIMLRKAIGDSISNIILKANTIEIGCDSATITKLGNNDCSIIRYLVADSCNYATDTEVFGQFHVYLFVKFTSKKKTITAQYDFRLHKWMLIDKDNKPLRRFDLLNVEILKYMLLAFPENQKLIEILKE
ncbi:MAG: hypothetical protein K2O54_00935, partial [Prevotella sp.]|nr:hypothetical protein [Prevotella sp.]